MKKTILLFATLALISVGVGIAKSATITWANTNGGDWNIATNWSPNQVPVSGDDVIITNSGTYSVTNAPSVTLDKLILGGTNGIQTVNLTSLTLTNAGIVNSNGVLNWGGGDLVGTLTVLQGGTLSISNSVYFDESSPYNGNAALTNYGTVIWAGSMTSYANAGSLGGSATVDNAGLWEAVGDNSMTIATSGGTNTFINTGTLEKIGGNSASTINWGFTSSGIIQTTSGSFNLNWSGPSTLNGNLTLSGTITTPLIVASNAVLNLSSGDLVSSLTVLQGGTLSISNTMYFDEVSPYTNNAALTNYGIVIWAGNLTSYANAAGLGGSATIDNAALWEAVGDNTIGLATASTNFFINTGTLEKIGGTGASTINWNFINNGGTVNTSIGSFSMGNWIASGLVHGNATFSGGTIAGTLASDAVMNFSATINAALTVSSNAVANWNGGNLESSLTVLQGGTLSISNTVYFDESSPYNGNAALTNYGTVIWAGSITSYANEGGQGGSATIDNAGLWEAAGNTTIGFATASTNFFINTGTLEKIGGTGASTINWNFASTGTIDTSSGAFTLDWNGPSTLNGNLTLAGSTLTSPLIVASNAVLNLSGDDLESSLTVLQGGTLSISNAVYFDEISPYNSNAALTNYGTVIWAGNIASYANAGSLGGSATIDNAGLWESVGDNSISVGASGGTNTFINTGMLEKIGGTGTTTISWDFDSVGGTLETPVGYFTLSGNWSGNNLVYGNASVSGNIGGIIGSNAVFNWMGGDLLGALTVAQGGTLSISNTVYFDEVSPYTNNAALTNYGTVIWAANITSYANEGSLGGSATIDNAGLWESVGDNSISLLTTSTNFFINTGTLEKIGGTGTSTISWNFLNNGGILGSQTNTLSLAGNYDLTGGTLNFGINSLTGFGKIRLSGSPAALTGSVSANLNNGYVPATGNSFPVLTYSSESGTFTNLISPFPIALGSNYGSTIFTLTVLNVRPTLNTISSQNLDEQTTLNVNASATDPDGGQSLTYALVSGPGGLNVSSAGAISWTPDEAQGPSSNLVVVQVTDNGTPALSATNSFVVTVNEINVPPQLTVPSDQVLNEQTALNISAVASDSDIPANPLTFALVSPPNGMTINTNTGAISWTPTEAQGPGVYTVKVVVTDLNTNAINQQSFSVTNSFMVTVNEVNVAPVLTVPSDQTMNEQTPLNLFAPATDSDVPANPLTFALVSGPMGLNVAANGNITWTPSEAQGPGVYTVFVKVSDFNSAAVNSTSLSVTNSFQITVNEVNVAPVLGTLNNFTVNPGQTVSFTATATDSDLPTNTLTFSLVSPPTGATISGGGLFNWRVPVSFANSTNAVQMRVTDNGSPNLSDTKSFNVTVNPLATVILTPVNYTNSQFKVQVSGTTGPDYIIVGSSNLLQWSDLFTNFSPATPFQFTDTNNSSLTKRFYRARLAP